LFQETAVMKTSSLAATLLLLTIGFGALGCGGGASSVDLGDSSTGNLLWGTVHYLYEVRDLDKALAYADATLEIHGEEARSQQASLSGFPATEPPEATYEYRTLNNVGFVSMVRGEILREKGDLAGAREAYTATIEQFGYAQVQDLGEWQGYLPSVPRDERGFVKVAAATEALLANLDELEAMEASGG